MTSEDSQRYFRFRALTYESPHLFHNPQPLQEPISQILRAYRNDKTISLERTTFQHIVDFIATYHTECKTHRRLDIALMDFQLSIHDLQCILDVDAIIDLLLARTKDPNAAEQTYEYGVTFAPETCEKCRMFLPQKNQDQNK